MCKNKVTAMFHIVEFLENQEVEVVPALWVADQVRQWPPHYKYDDLVKPIRNGEQPGHTWDAFSVGVLYTAANYKTARLKLPQAETHTDLQTAEEEDEDDTPKTKQKWLSHIASPSSYSPLFNMNKLHAHRGLSKPPQSPSQQHPTGPTTSLNKLNSHHVQANGDMNDGHSSQTILSGSHCSPPPLYNPDPNLVSCVPVSPRTSVVEDGSERTGLETTKGPLKLLLSPGPQS